VVQVVALRLLLRVPRWWLPVWDAVEHDCSPALFGCFVVVVAAGDGQGVEVGGSAPGPVGGVVDLCVRGGAVTAGEGAAAVAGEECFVGSASACAARQRASLMVRFPPWWVVARPARRSRSVRVRVMISCAGRPAWSGSSPVLSSRRPASSNASCSRCPGVRWSGPRASSGRRAASGVRMASQIAWQVGVSCPSSSPVESGSRVRFSRRWACCSRSSAGLGPSGSRWARIR
jgi:hypothetical protein